VLALTAPLVQPLVATRMVWLLLLLPSKDNLSIQSIKSVIPAASVDSIMTPPIWPANNAHSALLHVVSTPRLVSTTLLELLPDTTGMLLHKHAIAILDSILVSVQRNHQAKTLRRNQSALVTPPEIASITRTWITLELPLQDSLAQTMIMDITIKSKFHLLKVLLATITICSTGNILSNLDQTISRALTVPLRLMPTVCLVSLLSIALITNLYLNTQLSDQSNR